MPLKQTPGMGLNELQRVERLTKLCEELQAAVENAGNQRRLLEEVKQAAQGLLSDSDAETRSAYKKSLLKK